MFTGETIGRKGDFVGAEMLKNVLDFFKTAIGILHGVGSPIKIVALAIILTLAIVWVFGSGILEFTKTVREKHNWLINAEKKYSRFFGVLYSGKARFLMLFVVLCFFALDWREATTISPPIVKAPTVPIVQFVVQSSLDTRVKEATESPTSLRRRTINLAYDIVDFWASHPFTIAVKVQNPTTDEERQRNAAFDKFWTDTGADYRRRQFNQRITGVVNEYKSKGVPIGYLFVYETQPERMLGGPLGDGGDPLADCARRIGGDGVCQLYELAYHVDAYDRRIDLLPKQPK